MLGIGWRIAGTSKAGVLGDASGATKGTFTTGIEAWASSTCREIHEKVVGDPHKR